MKKTILCVMAPQGRGKTSSIRRVDEILQFYGAKLVKELFEEGNDFWYVFEEDINESGQDGYTEPKEAFIEEYSVNDTSFVSSTFGK